MLSATIMNNIIGHTHHWVAVAEVRTADGSWQTASAANKQRLRCGCSRLSCSVMLCAADIDTLVMMYGTLYHLPSPVCRCLQVEWQTASSVWLTRMECQNGSRQEEWVWPLRPLDSTILHSATWLAGNKNSPRGKKKQEITSRCWRPYHLAEVHAVVRILVHWNFHPGSLPGFSIGASLCEWDISWSEICYKQVVKWPKAKGCTTSA